MRKLINAVLKIMVINPKYDYIIIIVITLAIIAVIAVIYKSSNKFAVIKII